MSAIGISALLACGITTVHPETLNALIQTESGYNPYAVAVVNGKRILQPKTREEAELAISELEDKGVNYSVGLGQINRSNFEKYGVTGYDLLDQCTNLEISQKILNECYAGSPGGTVAEAFSCYYSGNYSYGFIRENIGSKHTAYVERVINNFVLQENFFVPSVKPEIPFALSKVQEYGKQKKSPVVLKARKSGTNPVRVVKNLPKQTDMLKSNAETTQIFKF